MKKYLKVTLNKTLGRLIIAFLLLCTAMVPASCGSRKAQVEISKTSTSDKSKEQVESSKESDSSSKTQSESSEIKGKVKENTETTVITRYDKDTGNQIEVITTTKQGKTVSNSEKKNKTITEAYLRTVEKLKTITIKEVKTQTKYKNKATDANNNALYYMLFALGGLIILACLAYKWFTRGE